MSAVPWQHRQRRACCFSSMGSLLAPPLAVEACSRLRGRRLGSALPMRPHSRPASRPPERATTAPRPAQAWIHDKLVEREKARMRRDFATADAIREGLFEAGVEVVEGFPTPTSGAPEGEPGFPGRGIPVRDAIETGA